MQTEVNKSVGESESYISRYRWPLGIFAFFLILAVADGFIARAAFTNLPEVTVEHPYESGLQYQETVSELRLAAELGLRANLKTIDLGEQRYRLNCVLGAQDPELSLSVPQVVLQARHGQFSKFDFSAVLQPDPEVPGQFFAEIPLAKPGVWRITLLIPARQSTARLELTEHLP